MIVADILALATLPARAEVAADRFWQAQLRAAEETLRVAADTRRAFYRAVAARQLAGFFQQAQSAAQTASELARRLGESGAMNKLDQAREQVFYAEVTAQLATARQRAASERERLVRGGSDGAGMTISKLGMPKFGLVMKEGALVAWLVEEGAEIAAGDEVAEVETDKINGAVEAPEAGVLRRQVAKVGDVVPVGGLLGVLADSGVTEEEIDAYVAEFQATFVPDSEDEDAGPRTETVTTGGRALNGCGHPA